FTNGQVINHCYQTMQDIPKFDNLAWLVSQDLRQQQFKFIGPTIVYAFLQAGGVINDHTADCFLAKNRAVN
ncbi:MAG: DNA-3-methyladenine glycosylase I, partial [Bombilactobacillus sp.]